MSLGEDLLAEPPGRRERRDALDTVSAVVSQGDFLSAQAAGDGRRAATSWLSLSAF